MKKFALYTLVLALCIIIPSSASALPDVGIGEGVTLRNPWEMTHGFDWLWGDYSFYEPCAGNRYWRDLPDHALSTQYYGAEVHNIYETQVDGTDVAVEIYYYGNVWRYVGDASMVAVDDRGFARPVTVGIGHHIHPIYMPDIKQPLFEWRMHRADGKNPYSVAVVWASTGEELTDVLWGAVLAELGPDFDEWLTEDGQ